MSVLQQVDAHFFRVVDRVEQVGDDSIGVLHALQ
jgi:uncharacterized protein YdcH (DUF465 family)